ncbi:flagellar hook-basal body complex protein FliE [Geotalea sp. SG265]|uniref:flagellar hook-basal body complex protein FliE n=1 Tax=Geotalea sp. SG265 TaxID=2922867 RepID=UPI001FAF9345|nr:flagellar hook-basal body complex protein FliE [Geotalea sp. SG265]
MVIKAIEGGTGIGQAFPAPAAKEKAGAAPVESFSTFLGEMVGKVNDLQQTADKSIQSLATGESQGLHEVMLAVEKASISFQFLTQVRNKAVEAYQEIMRMPV